MAVQQDQRADAGSFARQQPGGGVFGVVEYRFIRVVQVAPADLDAHVFDAVFARTCAESALHLRHGGC